jgi:hypothetical protein
LFPGLFSDDFCAIHQRSAGGKERLRVARAGNIHDGPAKNRKNREKEGQKY